MQELSVQMDELLLCEHMSYQCKSQMYFESIGEFDLDQQLQLNY